MSKSSASMDGLMMSVWLIVTWEMIVVFGWSVIAPEKNVRFMKPIDYN